jgi:hypothetical protein
MLFIPRYFGRFRRRYELPINQGNDKSASNQVKHIGSNVAKVTVFFSCVCVQQIDVPRPIPIAIVDGQH